MMEVAFNYRHKIIKVHILSIHILSCIQITIVINIISSNFIHNKYCYKFITVILYKPYFNSYECPKLNNRF